MELFGIRAGEFLPLILQQCLVGLAGVDVDAEAKRQCFSGFNSIRPVKERRLDQFIGHRRDVPRHQMPQIAWVVKERHASPLAAGEVER